MNRLWHRSSVLLLCVVQLTFASRISLAEERASGEKLFPKETLAFFTISDVPEFKTKWDKTSVGQLLHDPQLKPFLDDVKDKLDEGSKKLDDQVGVSLGDLLELPQGELTLAVMEQPARKIAAVLVLEYGDKQETVDKLLKKMEDALKEEEAEHSTEEIDDVTLHIYKLKTDGDNPFTTVAYFADEDTLVFSNEVDALKEVLERWDGKSDDTLAQNEQFAYIQSQCKMESGEPLIKMFINPIGLINSGISIAQASFPQAGMALGFLPLLGIDAMKGWGGAVDFEEGDFEAIANFFFYCDSSKGLMGVFNFPAAQLAPPKWVPATVGSYAVMNWNVQGAYTAIETLVDSFQGRGSTARFLEQQASQGPMIHLKKDLLDHLDGKINVIQSVASEKDDEGPPIPEFFLALGLKDATKMKKTLAAAAKASGPNMESRDFNGETIYEIQQPGTGATVSVAVTEGQLVVTNDTPMLEGIMRGKAGQRAALVDSPDYKKIAKFFPSKTSMLSFQRSDAQLKMYYDLLKNANSNDALEGIDVSKLPPFEAIAKYFQASGGYMVPDKKGAKSVSFSLKRSD
jgi:hypothetical protein